MFIKVLSITKDYIACRKYRHLVDKDALRYKCLFDCLDPIWHICATVDEVIVVH